MIDLTLYMSDNVIKSTARKRGQIIYGAQAIKAHIGPFARSTNDYDIFSRQPKKAAREVEKKLDRMSGGNNFYVMPAMHPGTYKLKYIGWDNKRGTSDDIHLADYTKPTARRKTVMIRGNKYVAISEIIKDKRRAIADPAFKFRHAKDRDDLERIKLARQIKRRY